MLTKISRNCMCFALMASLSFALLGCGKQEEVQPQAIAVKTMQVISKSTSITSEYAGQIQGLNEVPVQARVSGHVMEKYIKGGELVKQGDPLFKIDSRQYLSNYLSAQAQLAQSQAQLANISVDSKRYRDLYAASAIAEQMLTTQEAMERQQSALVNAQSALAQKAQDDLSDTLVRSPIDGRLYVNDVSVGTFVQPGATVLVTVGVVDPVYAQFSVSENEYLEMRKLYQENFTGWGDEVKITLSDGSEYPLTGKVTQVDRGMGANSGTLTVKASFDNPDGVLLPGMFSRVRIEGMTIPNAFLVPQRAVQQVLEKSYVMIVTQDNRVQARQVELGRKTGSFWIVEKGLAGDETVVVEGLTKIQEDVVVEPTLLVPQDLQLVFE